MKQLLALSMISMLQVAEASAINWEGHDEWLDDVPIIDEFTKDVPEPLPKAMPGCEERARRASANSHEQVPLPGVNCRPEKKEKPQVR